MNILIVTENLPFDAVKFKGVTAIHIQLFLMAREMSALGHNVALLPIQVDNRNSSKQGPNAPLSAKADEQSEFAMLPPVFVNGRKTSERGIGPVYRFTRVIGALLSIAPMREFYPSIILGSEIKKCADRFGADILLSFMSPLAVGAIATVMTYPRVIFQGDIDFLSDRVRLEFDSLFQISDVKRKSRIRRRLGRIVREVRIRRFEACHRHVSLCSDVIVNASASNNQYYQSIGHPKVAYVGTTWLERPAVPVERREGEARDGSNTRPFKIIGHVGFLNMTASTFGLDYLLKHVMPALRREMTGHAFEVHIIGGGAPAESLRAYLEQENIVIRGYVDDLDSELLDSNIFLFLNNAGPLKAIFSRQIMAWALGLCLVVHEGSLVVVPELAHGDNALVRGIAARTGVVGQTCLS